MNQESTGNIADAVRALSGIATPHISDAMAKRLSRKLKHQTMDAGIKPVWPQFKLCGPAYTVRCYPGATYAMEKAIAEADPGTVIVCDGQSSEAGVMMGEIMSTVAQQRGVCGAVVDGAVRDLEDLKELGFPVFARHVTPRSGTFDQLGDVQVPITCGAVVVNPGDIVAGDVNGVVVVPRAIAAAVARASEDLVRWETVLKEGIVQGLSMAEAAKACPPVSIRQI